MNDRVIRMNALCTKLSMSRSSIFDKLSPQSKRYDPTFPRQFKIGARSAGWLESEVTAWVNQQCEQRNDNAKTQGRRA